MSNVSKLFSPAVPSSTATSKNKEGYPAWERPLKEQYLQLLLTNTLTNTYYVSQKELLKESIELHDKMLHTDPAFMSKAAVYARNSGFMRTQPILALAKLASIPGPHFESIFDSVIRTPNDLSDFFTILKSIRGSEGGRRIKRVAGKWIAQHINEYWAIKYGSDRGNGYSLNDMIRITHPKCEYNAIVAYLLGKEVSLQGLVQISAFEALKKATKDEDKINLITQGRLPHEVATTFAGKSQSVWAAIVPQMPIFALLKNLATIERHGVMPLVRDQIVSVFTNKDAVKNSKILPFRFIDAMNHVTDGKVKDALRFAVESSFESIPDLEGKVAVLQDVSPSMFYGEMNRTASILSVALMKKTQGNGELVIFGSTAKKETVSMYDSLLTQADRLATLNIGGTDQGAAISVLLNEKKSVDSMIIITDGQQNSGTPFMDVLAKYRQNVNKNVKVFVVDVSPYANAITATKDPNTFYVYGWNDQVLNYISLATKGVGSMVGLIEG